MERGKRWEGKAVKSLWEPPHDPLTCNGRVVAAKWKLRSEISFATRPPSIPSPSSPLLYLIFFTSSLPSSYSIVFFLLYFLSPLFTLFVLPNNPSFFLSLLLCSPFLLCLIFPPVSSPPLYSLQLFVFPLSPSPSSSPCLPLFSSPPSSLTPCKWASRRRCCGEIVKVALRFN